MAKLTEIFKKYRPSAETREFALDCGKVEMRKSDASETRWEAVVFPSRVWPKRTVHKAENEINSAYDSVYSVRIATRYPAQLFDPDVLFDLISDAGRRGLLPGGFFSDCRVSLGDGRINVSILFGEGSLGFLEIQDAERRISALVRDEFGVSMETVITEADGYVPYSESDEMREFLDDIDRKCLASLEEYERAGERAGSESEKDEKPALNLKKITSAFDQSALAVCEDGICRIGSTEFDLREPETLWGEPFRPVPVSVCSVPAPRRDVTLVGTVFKTSCESRGRNSDTYYLSFAIFDGNSSIDVKFPPDREKKIRKISQHIDDGKVLAVHGDVKRDQKSGELFLHPDAFSAVKRLYRTDGAKEKRVELHLHTSMSSMDAITAPGDVVKTAMKWGMKSIAVTDHGNVQAFPEIMVALDKKYDKSGIPPEEQFKPIYGIEAYFVNDTASPIEGDCEGDFGIPTVVFDLETTGLSAVSDRIIEIGAVKIEGGKVTDRFSSFVDPGIHIPEFITGKTGISDADVAGAPKIEEILPEFAEFFGGCLLVAHNADFDTGFIRENCARLGIPFTNPRLDTVSLSRFLNRDLSRHRLDTLAQYFKLGDFNHHRAVDDAEMLSLIYLKMIEKMRSEEITDLAGLREAALTSSDPKKLPSHHMVILVQNQKGMKNLYRLISESYLNYYYYNPRIPKTRLDKYREGLLLGSACSGGELFEAILDNRPESEIEEIASYYDYLEVQPVGNDSYLVEEGKLESFDDIRRISERIVRLGEKLGKPVVATSDSHFIDPQDEIYRRILQVGNKMKNADREIPLYLRTTEEMLDEFAWLGREKAYEIVVTNTNKIADLIERVRPIPKGSYPPHLEGSNEELSEKCWARAKANFGDLLPENVRSRLKTELDSIITHGFAVLYVIAERLVSFSESQGYLVGSRGSVGSSFAATMGGISEVNPLPPHYRCPKCRFSDFSNVGGVGSGFDLPDAFCPVCGTKLEADGQDIPFETFLGFHGEKSPDIDLNFSGDVQGKVHKFTEDLFGSENVFKAGTISTLADKTAYGYVMKYFENRGEMLPRAEIDRIVTRCMGVKKTTGQHPGGIIVVPRDRDVYDFTPIQHPADKANSDIITTHYAFTYLHDTILKLDELGHDIPTKYRYLEIYSGIPVTDVPMNDRSVYSLFESTEPLGIEQMSREDPDTRLCGLSTGTLGIPEMGTSFIQGVLLDAKPKNFADLLQISGLTHGTDVWLGNAQDLIRNGTCTISEVVGTRDGIMLDLIRYGVEKSMAFSIMEKVRKNKKGEQLPDEMYSAMREAGVPEWYMGSLQKIKYMFPKAHAAAYVMSAVRLAWFKIHKPVAFYCAMFTVAPDGFDGMSAVRGREAVRKLLAEIDSRGKEATANDQRTASCMQLAHECIMRGIKFLRASLDRSDSKRFLPENGNIRIPFSALPGLGESAAAAIVAEREKEPFMSVEDLRTRTGVNKSVIAVLRDSGALGDLPESNQMSLFDLL